MMMIVGGLGVWVRICLALWDI